MTSLGRSTLTGELSAMAPVDALSLINVSRDMTYRTLLNRVAREKEIRGSVTTRQTRRSASLPNESQLQGELRLSKSFPSFSATTSSIKRKGKYSKSGGPLTHSSNRSRARKRTPLTVEEFTSEVEKERRLSAGDNLVIEFQENRRKSRRKKRQTTLHDFTATVNAEREKVKIYHVVGAETSVSRNQGTLKDFAFAVNQQKAKLIEEELAESELMEKNSAQVVDGQHALLQSDVHDDDVFQGTEAISNASMNDEQSSVRQKNVAMLAKSSSRFLSLSSQDQHQQVAEENIPDPVQPLHFATGSHVKIPFTPKRGQVADSSKGNMVNQKSLSQQIQWSPRSSNSSRSNDDVLSIIPPRISPTTASLSQNRRTSKSNSNKKGLTKQIQQSPGTPKSEDDVLSRILNQRTPKEKTFHNQSDLRLSLLSAQIASVFSPETNQDLNASKESSTEPQPSTSGLQKRSNVVDDDDTTKKQGTRKKKGLVVAKPKRQLPVFGKSKALFQHFCRMPVARDALPLVEESVELFFKNLVIDLEAYAQHAKRNTVLPEDVILLMKRQRYITKNHSLAFLVAKHMPMQYREEMIPCLKPDGTIFP